MTNELVGGWVGGWVGGRKIRSPRNDKKGHIRVYTIGYVNENTKASTNKNIRKKKPKTGLVQTQNTKKIEEKPESYLRMKIQEQRKNGWNARTQTLLKQCPNTQYKNLGPR